MEWSVILVGILLSSAAHPIGRALQRKAHVRHKKRVALDLKNRNLDDRVRTTTVPESIKLTLRGSFDLLKFYPYDKEQCLTMKAECTNSEVPCCSIRKYKDGNIYTIERVCYTTPLQIIRHEKVKRDTRKAYNSSTNEIELL